MGIRKIILLNNIEGGERTFSSSPLFVYIVYKGVDWVLFEIDLFGLLIGRFIV